MKKSIYLFLTLIVATCSFAFVEKDAVEEVCFEESNAAYYNSELVTYETYGTCGQYFRSAATGEQIAVVKKPEDFYPVSGRQYYITRIPFQYSAPYCDMYEITSWSPASYYYW